MPSVATLASTLAQLLIADATRLATETGAVKRRRKFDGASLVQTLVLGWLATPAGSLADMCRMAATLDVSITPEGLNKRFTPEAAILLARLLDLATDVMLDGESAGLPALEQFTQVCVDDSSTISLPAELADIWQGCGGSHGGEAAVKLQVRLDLRHGRLIGPVLEDGRSQDKQAPQQDWPIPTGGLRIIDLGYVSLGVLQRMTAEGSHWLCRYHPQFSFQDAAGSWHHASELAGLLHQVQTEATWTVLIGKTARIPCRMLIQRVAPELAQARRERLQERAERKGQAPSPVSLALADWTILLTSLATLAVAPALALYRARWQIEWLFRLWKQGGQVDEWRTTNPLRILCELLAKLLGCVLQHWLLLEPCWARANRSVVRAAATVRAYAIPLALALAASRTALCRTLTTLRRCLAATPPTSTRRARPATFQRLTAVGEA